MSVSNNRVVGVSHTVLEAYAISSEDFETALVEVDSLVAVAEGRIRVAVDRLGSLKEAYVGHSGGKDSVLVRYLTDRLYGLEGVWSIHSPKPQGVLNEVHPLTRNFLYDLPHPTLYLHGSPEPYGFKLQIDGTRRTEASRDDGRSTDVIIDGSPLSRTQLPAYTDCGIFDLALVFPIFDWTDLQVWAAIHKYQIPYSLEYLG